MSDGTRCNPLTPPIPRGVAAPKSYGIAGIERVSWQPCRRQYLLGYTVQAQQTSRSKMVPQLKITWEMLRHAVAIYLQYAYPDGQIPAVVQQRIAWDEQRPILDAIGSPPFECYAAKAPFQCTVHALRLGSVNYPNLKLEIRPFPSKFGFVFWVNTHDEFFSICPTMPDADEWAQVVRRNRELKQAAERGWCAHALPTFTSSLADELSDGHP